MDLPHRSSSPTAERMFKGRKAEILAQIAMVPKKTLEEYGQKLTGFILYDLCLKAIKDPKASDPEACRFDFFLFTCAQKSVTREIFFGGGRNVQNLRSTEGFG